MKLHLESDCDFAVFGALLGFEPGYKKIAALHLGWWQLTLEFGSGDYYDFEDVRREWSS